MVWMTNKFTNVLISDGFSYLDIVIVLYLEFPLWIDLFLDYFLLWCLVLNFRLLVVNILWWMALRFFVLRSRVRILHFLNLCALLDLFGGFSIIIVLLRRSLPIL